MLCQEAVLWYCNTLRWTTLLKRNTLDLLYNIASFSLIRNILKVHPFIEVDVLIVTSIV